MPVAVRLRRKKKSRPRAQRAQARKTKQAEQEIGFIGKALRGLGGLGGSALGGLVGQSGAGANIGSGLGAALSRWVGAGDYEVKSNSLIAKAASGIPMMHKTNQTVVVRHKEFVTQVIGYQDFTVQRILHINPGNRQLFPWLSNIALRFQEYDIKGLVFHYVPTSGQYSTAGTALGSVMMQTSYRADEEPPETKVEMMNEYWANEVVPSDTMCHPIECDPRENPFQIHYTKADGISVSEPLLYDIGTTFLATGGCPTNNTILGDLWVTYEIELKKPLVNSSLSLVGNYSSRFDNPGSSTFFSGTEHVRYRGLDLSFSGRTITIPAGSTGSYAIVLSIRSGGGLVGTTATSWGFSTAPTLSGCVAVNWFQDRAFIGCVNTATDVNTGTLTYMCAVQKIRSEIDAMVEIPAAVWNSGTTDSLFFECYRYAN